jgi:hypothetical protein
VRYPNLRYGNPTEFAYYVMTYAGGAAAVARMLRRDERTVRDWLSGRQRLPWWVPEIMRLQRLESASIQRQMFINITTKPATARLGVVTHAGQLELRRPDEKKPRPVTALRLSDFDPVDPVISSYGA